MVSFMSVPLANSPESTLSTNDPGDDVQRRFRYQAGYAALISLDLLDENSEFEEIFCEHHEDTLIKKKDGKFSGVQVKTRRPGRDPFKSDDDQILNAISRFVEQEIEYPGYYSRFVLATNYTFWSDKENSKNLKYLVNLAKQTKTSTLQIVTPKTFTSYIKKIVKIVKSRTNKSVDFDIGLDVLCKIEIQENLPKFDDLENRIIRNIPEFFNAENAGLADLNKAAKALINKMFDASSLQHVNPKQAYFSLYQNPVKLKTDAVIEGKRITKETVEGVLREILSNEILLSKKNQISISDLPRGMRKLELKMAKGNISARNINLAKDHKFSTEKLLNGWIYKYGPEKAEKRYDQLSIIIGTECQEAYDLVVTEDILFGQKMLNDIRQRLRQRLSEDPSSFFGCKYEHLLGFAAMLTELCEVWWSEEFVIPEDGVA